MISYVDYFALTVASLSYRGNICRLQALFERLERKASRLGISFSVAKTELNVGLEQPIANGAKRTVLPGGGRKQVSLSRRVLPRGP